MMKKTLSLLLLSFLILSLFACNTSDGSIKAKASGDVDYRQGGVAVTLPKYLAPEEDDQSVLCVRYLPEKVEYSVMCVTPEEIEKNGLYSDISAYDYATLLIADLGLNELNAEVTGTYETLLPTADGDNAYFAFGDIDLEDENGTLYKQVYARRSEDGSIWLFYGVCNEEFADTYSSLFSSWARSADFYRE